LSHENKLLIITNNKRTNLESAFENRGMILGEKEVVFFE